MNKEFSPALEDQESLEIKKRVRKIRKFYKELITWGATSIVLIAINLFVSGSITWAKYPVFFWGIAILIQFIAILRMRHFSRQWEDKMVRKLAGEGGTGTSEAPDYSEELLQNEHIKEKEPAPLSEYRTLRKPWKDEDLV